MNPAIALVAAILFITIIVLWLLLRPLLAQRATTDVAASDPGNASGAANTNVEALRVELAEARRDHQLGLLTADGLVEAERELQSRVLAEAETERVARAGRYPRTAIALGVMVPLLAVGSYVLVGSPAAAIPEVVRPQTASAGTAGQNPEQQMDELFRMAEERLKQNPGDLKGWLLLARAKSSVGRFAEALQAYEKATALAADDADVWADYADAAAGQAQGKIDGQPITLVNKALAIDPRNPKALLLKGTWEIQQSQFSAAEKTFTLARSLVEPGSGFAQIADNALADIKSRNGGTSAGGNGAEPTANGAPLAAVQLQLGAEARKAATSSSAVFLIVRAAGADRGPPLAAKRIDVGALDQPVSLTTADAMIGGAGLKAGVEVSLQARLSINGQPTAQTGDWQSQKTSTRLPTTTTLSIDQRLSQ